MKIQRKCLSEKREESGAMTNMKTTLVILTKNEVEGLRQIYPKLPLNEIDECFLLDANSNDGTIEFARSKGLKVVQQKVQGYGRAFNQAVEVATGDIIVFFRPDGNENPEDIIKLIQEIKGGHDMVIASRFAKGGKSDDSDDPLLLRRMGNKFFTWLANMLWGYSLTDSINGFRAITKTAFQKLKIDADSFNVEYQMSIRAMKANMSIAEIPTIEGKRIGGKRKSHTRNFYKFIWTVVREVLAGYRPEN